MARYVKFPGTAGSYASTDDVNLLDADTAHVFQSVGLRGPGARFTAPAQIADAAAVFGFASQADVTDDNAAPGAQRFGINGAEVGTNPFTTVVAGQTTTLLLQWRGDPITVGIRAVFYDAANGSTGTLSGTTTTLPTEYGWASEQFVAPALSVKVLFQVFCNDGPAIGSEVFVGGAMIADGTVATFVPSLRIVGDLQLNAEGQWPTPVGTTAFVAKGDFGDALFSLFNSGAEFRYRAFRTGGDVNAFCVGTVWDTPSLLTITDTIPGDGTGHIIVNQNGNDLYNVVQGGVGDIRTQNIDIMTVMADSGGANAAVGDVYWWELLDGLDGPVVARFDADDVPT